VFHSGAGGAKLAGKALGSYCSRADVTKRKMIILSFITAVLVSFVLGALMIGWVRQADIDALRNELELAKDREMRLRDKHAELQSSLWAMREQSKWA